MKKLLIASDCYLPRWDGVVRFLLEVVPQLAHEYEVTLVVPDFGASRPVENVRLVQFPLIRIMFGDIEFTGLNYRAIRQLAAEADLVFSQTIGPIGMSAICAGKSMKKPVLSYIHSVEWDLSTRSVKRFKRIANSLTKKIARWAYRKCSLLVVPSHEVGEIYRRAGIETSSEVVHLGTDTEKFRPPEDKALAKKRLGIDPYLKVVGFSGRIGREKDLMTLYRAFRRLEKQHPDLRLMIVGKGIREQQELFSSSRNIILPGSVDNVVEYLQAMDIFVLTSLTETSSLATMEAMACGLPVITTKAGFVKEYIREKQNGMFFPFRNSMVLSMKIAMLLENETLRETLGNSARATIIENFRWEDTVKGIKDILRRY